ncbi:hypothetical protein KJS94_12500 [Flavihumibacter rivuli]|uniref:hypothetical protein n=1 Tax=Flavihumibacter rivuli TaxID=2838156 RepID=UPI001BDE00B6|nr:hypothetical protein [Flavihumibacter rivuli]ULQ55463.1 hypothetical protein KJS94_12500 [Flavihumibacter rivuli]
MKKTVVFTGAGVSATFGYPLTRDLLPIIVNKINSGTLFNNIERNRRVAHKYREMLKQLLVSLSPGIKDYFGKNVPMDVLVKELPMVTELLSMVDQLINTNHCIVDWNNEIPGLLQIPKQLNDRWDMSNLKTIFEWAIIDSINRSRKYVLPKKMDDFVKWIRKENKGGSHFVSLVSTNYDVSLEWELLNYDDTYNADREIDYGVSWRDPVDEKDIIYNRPSKPLFKIFKLHGSTDWLKCKRCGFLYINPTVEIIDLIHQNRKTNINKCHCDYWPLHPVLVTMSYARRMDEPNLHEIWRNAFEELRVADNWIIIGYSLPPEDFNIRSMFLRALTGRTTKPNITVVQKGDGSKIYFDRFFGRGNYEYLCGGFEESVESLIAINKKTRRNRGS